MSQQGIVSNRPDPNLIVSNLKSGVTIYGVGPGTFNGILPPVVTTTGNYLGSDILNKNVFSENGYIYDNGTSLLLLFNTFGQTSGFTSLHTTAYFLNKSSGIVTALTEQNTSTNGSGGSMGGVYYDAGKIYSNATCGSLQTHTYIDVNTGIGGVNNVSFHNTGVTPPTSATFGGHTYTLSYVWNGTTVKIYFVNVS